MQPSKNAMQNLNEKMKKIHKTMQQKTLQHKLQQFHTKQCNKTKPNKNQNQTKETAQNSETLPLTMRVWVGAFTAWLVQKGVLGFAFRVFGFWA
jgi:transcription initiation factor TFIID subunit TAF12